MRRVPTFFLILGLTFIFVETSLRFFLPLRTSDSLRFYEYDATLGYKLKPGYQTTLTDYKQEYLANYIGAVGGVTDYSVYKKSVFALGDSFTQGTGNPVASSFPSFVDLIYNNSTGVYKPDLGVVNLGLAAFGGFQNLLAYEMYSNRLGTPEYVFYLGADNDFMDDLRFQSGYRHLQLVDNNPNIPFLPFFQFISNFEIVKRTKQLRQFYISRRLLDSISSAHTTSTSCESTAQRQQRHLDKLLILSRRDNFELIVSWVLNPLHSAPNNCSSYLWAKNWARQNGVAFADYAPSLFSVNRYWGGVPLTNDHSAGHYRSWVYLIIAQEFLAHLTHN